MIVLLALFIGCGEEPVAPPPTPEVAAPAPEAVEPAESHVPTVARASGVWEGPSGIARFVIAHIIDNQVPSERAQRLVADIRTDWALVIDPQSPEGCGTTKSPCARWLFRATDEVPEEGRGPVRGWSMIDSSESGRLTLPDDAPLDMGDSKRLAPLGAGVPVPTRNHPLPPPLPAEVEEAGE